MSRKRGLLQCCAIASTWTIICGNAFGAGGYEFIDFGLSGEQYAHSTIQRVNNSGAVSGALSLATDPFNPRAFLFQPEVGFLDLGQTIFGASGPVSSAAVTNTGQILGPGYIYTPGSGTVFPAPGIVWYPYDINSRGEVVGSSGNPNRTTQGTQAFYYNETSGTQYLGTLDHSNFYSSLGDINNVGLAVGQSSLASQDGQFVDRVVAISYTSQNGMREIPMFESAESGATAVNDAGTVIGYYRMEGDIFARAFVTQIDGLPRDLGQLGNSTSTFPTGMNEAGDIVGYSDGFAFLYREGIGMMNLDQFRPLGTEWIRLSYAGDINDRGEIVGSGLIRVLVDPELDEYEVRGAAFMLRPVPEPGTWLLFLVGLAFLGIGSTCRIVGRRAGF